MSKRLKTMLCLYAFLLYVPSLAYAGIPIEMVSSERVDQLRLFTGVVEAINQSTISAQTSGQITAVYFDVDDYVKKGDVIIRLNDKQQQSRLRKAQSSMEEAQTRLEQAKKEYARAKGIYAKKLIAKSAFDKARSTYRATEARLSAARATVAEATEQWQYTTIQAPYSGIVVKRFVEKGEVVRPGQALMTGLSLEHLRVVVDVPQDLVVRLRRKSGVFVFLSGQVPVKIESSDVTISPYADERTHTFRTRIQLPAGAGELYPGMTVKMGMVVGQRLQMTIPLSAVVIRSEISGIYIQRDDGVVFFRQIRLGEKTRDRVQVLSGLHDGEKVMLDPLAAVNLLKSQRAK